MRARAGTTWGVTVLLALVAVALSPGPASAHTFDTVGYSDITRHGDQVRYELLVDYQAFVSVSGVGGGVTTAAADAEKALRDGESAVADYLRDTLRIEADGVVCEPDGVETGVELRDDEPYARVLLDYQCRSDGAVEIRYTALLGDIDPNHRNIATYDLGADSGRFVFDSDHRALAVGEQNLGRQGYLFLALGVEHLLLGLDHLLFVVALLISARGVRDVLGVVTTFTIAHSIALGLTALGVTSVPSSVVEPLIALSIAYVAAENLLGRSGSRWRRAAVFGFGLLHGMGFAGGLDLAGEEGWSWVVPLASFNLGVELGQVAVVAALFPLLALLRRWSWSGRLLLLTSGAIALCGLVWFVKRLLT
jgi:hydrogenase/urease accessory protein HupE